MEKNYESKFTKLTTLVKLLKIFSSYCPNQNFWQKKHQIFPTAEPIIASINEMFMSIIFHAILYCLMYLLLLNIIINPNMDRNLKFQLYDYICLLLEAVPYNRHKDFLKCNHNFQVH